MLTFWEFLTAPLGLHVPGAELSFGNMAARCVVVFLTAVIAGRLADRRAIGGNSAFDVMLGVVLGSVLSRGINGQAAFFPSMGASLLLVLLHRALGRAACHFHWLSCLVKGRATVLVKAGAVDSKAMLANNITEDDLIENLRMNGNVGRTDQVKEAWFERDGKISVIRRKGAEE